MCSDNEGCVAHALSLWSAAMVRSDGRFRGGASKIAGSSPSTKTIPSAFPGKVSRAQKPGDG